MDLLRKARHWVTCVGCYYEISLKEKKIFLQKSTIVVPVGRCLYFKENVDIASLVKSLPSEICDEISFEFSKHLPSDTLYYERKRQSASELLDYTEIPTFANWVGENMHMLTKKEAVNILRNYENINQLNYDLTNLETLKLAKALN